MQSAFKTSIKILLVVALFAGAGYYYSTQKSNIKRGFYGLIERVRPCSMVYTYSIDTFDSRFGLKQSEFVTVLERSESVWEKALGRELFKRVDSDGDIRIRMKYDYRQKTSDTLEVISGTIDKTRSEYDSMRTRYNSLKELYAEKKSALESAISEYQSSGSKNRTQLNSIRSMENTLNIVVADINNLVPQLNSLAKQLNTTVETYNTVGASTGREFDEGNYVSDENGMSINVYQFDDENKLARLLEHEFGHAIGLDHVSNPNSIMYRLNESSSLSLSTEDVSALYSYCKKK